MFRPPGWIVIAAFIGPLIGACSRQASDEPTACYLPLDCGDDGCPTYAEITKEIDREARLVRERRTNWLAWMKKRGTRVSEDDATRTVRADPASWRSSPGCGEFTVFSRANGYTSQTVYFDRDLQIAAMHTTTDVGDGLPECRFWTHYGPEIRCDK